MGIQLSRRVMITLYVQEQVHRGGIIITIRERERGEDRQTTDDESN